MKPRACWKRVWVWWAVEHVPGPNITFALPYFNMSRTLFTSKMFFSATQYIRLTSIRTPEACIWCEIWAETLCAAAKKRETSMRLVVFWDIRLMAPPSGILEGLVSLWKNKTKQKTNERYSPTSPILRHLNAFIKCHDKKKKVCMLWWLPECRCWCWLCSRAIAQLA